MKAIAFFEENREPTPDKPNKIITGVIDDNAEKYINRLEQENKQLKEGLHKILDLNKRAINCDSQKVTIKYLLKQYDLIYETLGELQPGLMKGKK